MLNKDIKNGYDVIVVGAGIAGLTAAARLAQKGKKILLCEKQSQVGGLIGGFEREGFVFDGGIRALENAGTLIPMLNNLGIDAGLIKTDINIRIKDQTVTISQKDGLKNYGRMLARLFPNNVYDIARIVHHIEGTMRSMDVLYGVDNPLFSPVYEKMQSKKASRREMFGMIPWLASYLKTIFNINCSRGPVMETLYNLTDNRALCDMVAQHFFSGSADFFALGYFWLYGDYYYPKNSVSHVAHLLKEYISNRGGDIACDTPVLKINPHERSITLKQEKIVCYNKLIWCCSKKSLLKKTAHHGNRPHAKVMRQRGSDSVLTLYIATDIPSEKIAALIGSHAFFTPSTEGLSCIPKPTRESNAEQIHDYIDKFLTNTTYEISCPAVINPELAPPDCSALVVGTLFSYDITKLIKTLGEYDRFKERCCERIIYVLKQTLLPEIEHGMLFCELTTPLDIERMTANDDGAITGWSHHSRPMPATTGFTTIARSVLTEKDDIFQAGMWTFSPAGLPVSIITGWLAANRAL